MAVALLWAPEGCNCCVDRRDGQPLFLAGPVSAHLSTSRVGWLRACALTSALSSRQCLTFVLLTVMLNSESC